MASKKSATSGDFHLLPAAQLVAVLKSTFRKSDYEEVARVLTSREVEFSECKRKAAALEVDLRVSRSREEVAKARAERLLEELKRREQELEELEKKRELDCDLELQKDVVDSISGSANWQEVIAPSDSDEGFITVSSKEETLCEEVGVVSRKKETFCEEVDSDDDGEEDRAPLSQLLLKRPRRMDRGDGSRSGNRIGSCNVGAVNGSWKWSGAMRESREARTGEKGASFAGIKMANLLLSSVNNVSVKGVGSSQNRDGELCNAPARRVLFKCRYEKGGTDAGKCGLPLVGTGEAGIWGKGASFGALNEAMLPPVHTSSMSTRRLGVLENQDDVTGKVPQGKLLSECTPWKKPALSPSIGNGIQPRRLKNSDYQDDEQCKTAGSQKVFELGSPMPAKKVVNLDDQTDKLHKTPVQEVLSKSEHAKDAKLPESETSGSNSLLLKQPKVEGASAREVVYSPSDKSAVVEHHGRSTVNWECEVDMISSFMEKPELCLQAVCALYRQGNFVVESPKGRQPGNGEIITMDANKKVAWNRALNNYRLERLVCSIISSLHAGWRICQKVRSNCDGVDKYVRFIRRQ